MRILHVIPTLATAAGGPANAVVTFAIEASLLGHHIEIVTLDLGDLESATGEQLIEHRLGRGGTVGSYGYSPLLVKWMKNNRSRFDVCVIHGLWQYHSIGTWLGLKGWQGRYFIFTHGMLDPWFRQNRMKHLKKVVYWKLFESRVLRDAAAVIFTCDEERRASDRAFTPYKVHGIVTSYSSSDVPNPLSLMAAQFTARYPECAEKRIVLFLGRIDPKKGCDLLIDAFAAVLGDDKDFHLVLAGPDSVGWKEKLFVRTRELGIESKVTWTGLLSGSEKWEALAAAEIFCLPSHQENFGIAVAESLAASTPVIISDKVNIWPEIEKDGAGLVNGDTLQGTIEGLRRWLKCTPAVRKEFAERARQCYVDRYTVEKSVSALLQILDVC